MTTTDPPPLSTGGSVAPVPAVAEAFHPNGDQPAAPARRPRRRSLVATAAVLTVAAVAAAAAAGFWAANRGNSTGAAAGDGQPATTTVEATTRTLIDSETVSGTLGYADPRTIKATVGSGTITALPAVGTTIRRGQALYRVNDQPVTLLYGALPLYRDLDDGVTHGADVKQLETNLEILGYDPGTVDDTFTTTTRDAVKAFQDDLGVDQSGRIAADRFVVLPGAIRVGSLEAAVGDRLQGSTPLYDATTTQRVVSVDLDADQEGLAIKGAEATITLPNGSTTKATITDIGTVATSTSSSSSNGNGDTASADATIAVTLALDTPKDAGSLSNAPVTVALTRQEKKNAVTVPVTALVALAEGGYAVRVPDGTQPTGTRLVAVSPGLYADGQVEITAGLTAGQKVVVPQ